MKHDLELKVQAWLDGELPDREARHIGEWIAGDAQASALAAELGCIRQNMRGNETACALGENREFYWSKIERQIRREATQPRPDALPWYARWRKYMAPMAGAAALACAFVVAIWERESPAFDESASTGEGMEAVTFHDQSAQMTVVWLQDNSAAGQDQPAPKNLRYEDEPGTVIDLE
jgi:hypothetical protein